MVKTVSGYTYLKVASNLIANTVNAASYAVNTNFIANTSQLTLSGVTLSANGGVGSSGQVLTSNGTTASWVSPAANVSSISFGSTGLTPNTATTGAVTVAGTLGTGYGGTGSTSTQYCSLTTNVNGTLPSANGGTGFSTYATGDIIYASATNTLSKLTAGTNGYVLTLAGGVPTWAASTGGVTSFQTSLSGLTPSSPTTGAITLAGTLGVASGGTGATSLTAYAVLCGGTTSTGAVQSVASVGTSGQVLTSNGAGALPTFQSIVSGASISNDTSTASYEYPLFAAATTGTPTTIYTSNAKYLYKPSTGDLQASQIAASNGLVLNNATISTSYTVASGYNAMSVGPVTMSAGISVTLPSGSRWMVL